MYMVGVLMADDDIVDAGDGILRSSIRSRVSQKTDTSYLDEETTMSEFGDEHGVSIAD